VIPIQLCYPLTSTLSPLLSHSSSLHPRLRCKTPPSTILPPTQQPDTARASSHTRANSRIHLSYRRGCTGRGGKGCLLCSCLSWGWECVCIVGIWGYKKEGVRRVYIVWEAEHLRASATRRHIHPPSSFPPVRTDGCHPILHM
jgi:hypothetical protein